MVHTVTPSGALVHEMNYAFYDVAGNQHRRMAGHMQDTLLLFHHIQAARPEVLAGNEATLARLAERREEFAPHPLLEWFKKVSITVVDEVVDDEEHEDDAGDDQMNDWETDDGDDATQDHT